MTFALLLVTAKMYTSLCRIYMKLQDPSTLTGLDVETCSVSLGELMMCVRKAAARLRLHKGWGSGEQEKHGHCLRAPCSPDDRNKIQEMRRSLLNIVSVCSLYQDVSFQIKHI